MNRRVRRVAKPMLTAAIIGSGPNGLSAAIVLAASGIETTVFERNLQIGGACSTAETTLPGFRQDLGSSAYPLGIASPFFRSLPIDIPWIEPTAPCAHPLDDGTAVILEHSIEATAATLDASDRSSYRSLVTPLASRFPELAEDILRPIRHIPRHPFGLAQFASSAFLPAASGPLPFRWETWPSLVCGNGNSLRAFIGNPSFGGRGFGSHSGRPHERLADPARRCSNAPRCARSLSERSGRPG